jgi:hypothetical protein
MYGYKIQNLRKLRDQLYEPFLLYDEAGYEGWIRR